MTFLFPIFLFLIPFLSYQATLTPLSSSFSESDLQSFQWQYTADFPSSLSSNPPHITSCSGSLSIFGGPDIFQPYYFIAIQTTFQIPPHYSLDFSFILVRFGVWTSFLGMSLNVVFDTWSKTLNFANLYTDDGYFSSQISTCSSTSIYETMITYTFSPHYANSVVFSITDTYVLAESFSWGITEFSINYQTCDAACASCTGPLNTQCPTCLSTTVYVSGVNTCTFCDSTCLNCLGPNPTDCTICTTNNPYKLNFVNNQGECVSICPGQQAGDAGNFCVSCPQNCDACQYGAPSFCNTCSAGYSSNNGVCFQCGSSCLTCDYTNLSFCTSCYIGNYPLNGICYNCDTSCQSCYGNSFDNCLSCNDGMFLYQYQCVSQCPLGSVLNVTSNECLKCSSRCKTCNLLNGYQCYSCIDGFYLNDTDFTCNFCDNQCNLCEGTPDFCLTCSNSSNYLVNGTCLDKCPYNIIYQSQCLSECPNMTYYYQGSCMNTGILDVNIAEIKENSIYQLNFSANWDFLLNRLNDFLLISTNCSETLAFTSTLTNSSNENTFMILINFTMNNNVSQKCQISFNFTINFNNSDQRFILQTNYFSFPLSFYCQINQFLSNSICLPKEKISFSLDYTDLPDRISLQLLNNYQIPLNSLNESLIVSIQNYNQFKDYYYNLEYSQDTVYIIHLCYLTPIFNRPLLTISIQMPLIISLNFTNLDQNPVNKSIVLFDCYNYYNNYTEIMKQNSEVYNTLDLATSGSVLAMSFFNTNSKLGASVRGFMMIEIVFLLKYINLNYPENLRQYFDERLELLQSGQLIKSGYFNENTEEMDNLPLFYRFYDTSPYFLEMAGDLLIRLVFFLILGYLSWFFYYFSSVKKSHKKAPNFIQKMLIWLLKLIYESLVWEYVLAFFLMNHQEIFFNNITTLYYAPLISQMGTLNFSFAVIYLFVILIVFCYFCYILKKNGENFNKVKPEITSIPDFDSPRIIKELKKNHKFSPFALSLKENSIDKKEDPPHSKVTFSLKVQDILKKDPLNYQSLASSKSKIEESPDYKMKNNNIKSNLLEMVKKSGSSLNVSAISKTRILSREIFLLEKESKNGDDHTHILEKEKKISINQVVPLKFDMENCLKNEELPTKFTIIKASSPISDKKPHFEIIYKDLKRKNFTQRYFLIWDLIRQCIIVLIVLFFPNYPFMQITCINCLQFGFMMLSFWIKPFNNWFSVISFMVTELFVTTIFVCCLLIGVFDFMEVRNYNERIGIGNAIVICNLLFRVSMMLICIVNSVCNLIKSKKEL